jgi:hypothetical protein
VPARAAPLGARLFGIPALQTSRLPGSHDRKEAMTTTTKPALNKAEVAALKQIEKRFGGEMNGYERDLLVQIIRRHGTETTSEGAA